MPANIQYKVVQTREITVVATNLIDAAEVATLAFEGKSTKAEAAYIVDRVRETSLEVMID